MEQQHEPSSARSGPRTAPGSRDLVSDPLYRAGARRALEELDRQLPLGLWLVSSVHGGAYRVVVSLDRGYGVPPHGVSVPYSTTLCQRMVNGLGPRAAPDVGDAPAMRDAEVQAQFRIRCYVGAPVVHADGTLMGTVCGQDQHPQAAPDVHAVLPAVEAFAEMLGHLATATTDLVSTRSRAEQAEVVARTDALTGAASRAGWLDALDEAKRRADRSGRPLGLVCLDLNGLKSVNDSEGHLAGDELLRATAQALFDVVRRSDTVARLGGDEFAVVTDDASEQALAALAQRARYALVRAGVDAALGVALCPPLGELSEAWMRADAQMYTDKRTLRSG